MNTFYKIGILIGTTLGFSLPAFANIQQKQGITFVQRSQKLGKAITKYATQEVALKHIPKYVMGKAIDKFIKKYAPGVDSKNKNTKLVANLLSKYSLKSFVGGVITPLLSCDNYTWEQKKYKTVAYKDPLNLLHNMVLNIPPGIATKKGVEAIKNKCPQNNIISNDHIKDFGQFEIEEIVKGQIVSKAWKSILSEEVKNSSNPFLNLGSNISTWTMNQSKALAIAILYRHSRVAYS